MASDYLGYPVFVVDVLEAVSDRFQSPTRLEVCKGSAAHQDAQVDQYTPNMHTAKGLTDSDMDRNGQIN